MLDRIIAWVDPLRLDDRIVEPANRTGTQVVRRVKVLTGLQLNRQVQQFLIAQEFEGGPVETAAFVVAPEPEMLQVVESFRGEPPHPLIRQRSSSDFPPRTRTDSRAAWQLS